MNREIYELKSETNNGINFFQVYYNKSPFVVFHGIFRSFYPNGKREIIQTFYDDLKNGPVIIFNYKTFNNKLGQYENN